MKKHVEGKFKRKLSAFIALVMVIGLIPVQAYAEAEDIRDGDLVVYEMDGSFVLPTEEDETPDDETESPAKPKTLEIKGYVPGRYDEDGDYRYDTDAINTALETLFVKALVPEDIWNNSDLKDIENIGYQPLEMGSDIIGLINVPKGRVLLVKPTAQAVGEEADEEEFLWLVENVGEGDVAWADAHDMTIAVTAETKDLYASDRVEVNVSISGIVSLCSAGAVMEVPAYLEYVTGPSDGWSGSGTNYTYNKINLTKADLSNNTLNLGTFTFKVLPGSTHTTETYNLNVTVKNVEIIRSAGETAGFVSVASPLNKTQGIAVHAYEVRFCDGNTVLHTEYVDKDCCANASDCPDTKTNKTGYDFDGWYVNYEDGSAAFDFDTPISETTNIFGHWTAKTVTVTFDANGGMFSENETTESYSCAYDATFASVDVDVPRRDGYEFKGWCTDVECANVQDMDAQVMSMETTLYAKWEADESAWVARVNNVTSTSGVPSKTDGNTTWYYYDSLKDAIFAAETGTEADPTVITLLNETDERGITVSKKITLDLNGYVINGGSSDSVIKVESTGDLTITDTGTMATHKFTPGEDGLWVLDETNGTQTVNGGAITGGTAINGGGVYVDGGTFTLNGGNIVGNNGCSEGGGVYVSSGTFNMTGGEIVGNTAVTGGGVYQNGGTVTLGGTAKIENNTAGAAGSKTANNLYLPSGKTVAISSTAEPVTAGDKTMNVGVTLATGSGVVTSGMEGADYKSCFTSDVSGYKVIDMKEISTAATNDQVALAATVTLDVNGGTAGSVTSVDAVYGKPMPTIPYDAIPTYYGDSDSWSFTGYFDAQTGGTAFYDAAGNPIGNNIWTGTDKTGTLYAQWEENLDKVFAVREPGSNEVKKYDAELNKALEEAALKPGSSITLLKEYTAKSPPNSEAFSEVTLITSLRGVESMDLGSYDVNFKNTTNVTIRNIGIKTTGTVNVPSGAIVTVEGTTVISNLNVVDAGSLKVGALTSGKIEVSGITKEGAVFAEFAEGLTEAEKELAVSRLVCHGEGYELIAVYDKTTGKIYWQEGTREPYNYASLSMEGNIGLHYYLDLDYFEEVLGTKASEVVVTYSDPSKQSGAKRIDAYGGNHLTMPTKGTDKSKNGYGLYRFSAYAASGQMADEITFEVIDSEQNVLFQKTITVKELAVRYIEEFAAEDSKLVELCKTMLVYGGEAQKLFNYNYNESSLATYNVGDLPTDLSEVEIENHYPTGKRGNLEGFTLGAVSFVALSASAARVYYTLSEGCFPHDYTVTATINDQEYKKVRMDSRVENGKTEYYMEIYDIPAAKLGAQIRFYVKRASAPETIMIVQYNPLGYATAAKNNFGKALYQYYLSAVNFFGE